MMIFGVFAFVVLTLIWAGVLLSKLAEISRSDRGKRIWFFGVLIVILMIAVPIFLLGVAIKIVQIFEMQEAVIRFGDR